MGPELKRKGSSCDHPTIFIASFLAPLHSPLLPGSNWMKAKLETLGPGKNPGAPPPLATRKQPLVRHHRVLRSPSPFDSYLDESLPAQLSVPRFPTRIMGIIFDTLSPRVTVYWLLRSLNESATVCEHKRDCWVTTESENTSAQESLEENSREWAVTEIELGEFLKNLLVENLEKSQILSPVHESI